MQACTGAMVLCVNMQPCKHNNDHKYRYASKGFSRSPITVVSIIHSVMNIRACAEICRFIVEVYPQPYEQAPHAELQIMMQGVRCHFIWYELQLKAGI